MSHQKKHQKSSESIPEPLQPGKNRGKSKRLKPHQDKEDTTWEATQLELNLLDKQSSTPELVPEDNKTTSTVKSKQLEKSIQTQKSSVKLEEDSISEEKCLLPYWNESCKETSSKLLLLTKTDLLDSVSTYINGSASNLTAKSWFSTKQTYHQKQKWLKISLPFSTVSPVDCTDSESTRLRSKKIRIYPESGLKKEWNKWMAACRYCFNKAIAYQKENGRIGKLKLRNAIMQSDLPNWVKETPCHIRQNAIFDAHQAYSASRDCKFRSCKAPRQTIKFNSSNFSKGKWYSRLTGKLHFTASEAVPLKTDKASQLVKTKSGEWFAIFLEEVLPTENKLENIIALDPGVRTFLTGFDGQSFTEFGNGDIGRINRLCSHLDKLMSKCDLSKSKRQKQKMRKASARLRRKIRNLIDECHKQIASWLTKNYKVILLPTFETSEMTKKARRKIKKKTARNMLTWSHYRFKEFLKQKAELSGCNVLDITEEFTSKTCTKCGHVHTKLGGNKVFKCPECGHCLPRDFNGALGILLKALRATSILEYEDAIVVKCDDISCFTA